MIQKSSEITEQFSATRGSRILSTVDNTRLHYNLAAMVWEHFAVNLPRLVYLTLSVFTVLFMLLSLFIKERLYLGEAPVATLYGLIVGPRATNLLDPRSWPNHQQTILEFSRVVLVVQCFVVGLELPKRYVTRQWKSLFFLLVPVMLCGWLISSFFIWVLFRPLTWLECLICGACFNATDPLLASAAFGHGKFSKRIPRRLRHIILAESASNGVMAGPLLGLTLYLFRYLHAPKEALAKWILITVLYQCVFGAVLGIIIGLAARRAIKLADRRNLLDKESFLVFYFVLALFSAGAGSLLGVDEVLTGFCAGVAFDNDDWFSVRTEESNISNVINLLLNMSFFVYLGATMPWETYHSTDFGLTPWRLVVLSLSIFLLRRIPIMLALKHWIPDIKTVRESLFAGYFGPIGGGAVFAALLAQGVLDGSVKVGDKASVTNLIWPISTFVVICSIFFHGSSIAIWGFGKLLSNLTISFSFSQEQEGAPSWINRLPKIDVSDAFDNSVRNSLEAPQYSIKNKGKDRAVLQVDQRAAVKRLPALAYQSGTTIFVEDEDGQVTKSYTIPISTEGSLEKLRRTRLRVGNRSGGEASGSQGSPVVGSSKGERDGSQVVDHEIIPSGRRMSKDNFIDLLRKVDPDAGFEIISDRTTLDTHNNNDQATQRPASQGLGHQSNSSSTELENAVERRRRLAALGESSDPNDSDSEDDGEMRVPGASRANATTHSL